MAPAVQCRPLFGTPAVASYRLGRRKPHCFMYLLSLLPSLPTFFGALLLFIVIYLVDFALLVVEHRAWSMLGAGVC